MSTKHVLFLFLVLGDLLPPAANTSLPGAVQGPLRTLPESLVRKQGIAHRLLRRRLAIALFHQLVRGDLPEGEACPTEGDARGDHKLRHTGRLWRRGHGGSTLQWGRAPRV